MGKHRMSLTHKILRIVSTQLHNQVTPSTAMDVLESPNDKMISFFAIQYPIRSSEAMPTAMISCH